MAKKKNLDFNGLKTMILGLSIMAGALFVLQIARLIFDNIGIELAFSVLFLAGWIFIVKGLGILKFYRKEFKAGNFIGLIGVIISFLYGAAIIYNMIRSTRYGMISLNVVFLMFTLITLFMLGQRKIFQGIGELAYIQGHPGLRKRCISSWKLIWIFVILTIFGEQIGGFFTGIPMYVIVVVPATLALAVQLMGIRYLMVVYDTLGKNK